MKFKHSSGPWQICSNGDCPCGLIWESSGQFVIATKEALKYRYFSNAMILEEE